MANGTLVALPGGRFIMGADDFYPEERPARAAYVDAFAIDATPVTNAQFAAFVGATGHVTVAEAMAQTGSLVFTPPDHAVPLDDPTAWWRLVPGADWRHPLGPDSSIEMLADHPVVQVALADATAYADWAGKALPSEGQWEYAARGGLDGASYAWGDDPFPGERRMAKTWEGMFPWYNAAPPGLERTSPVGSYPANGHGLYDMIGNVWEWTRDPAPDQPGSDQPGPDPRCCSGGDGGSVAPRHVLKGGSHLCAPEHCQRYRPAARWPQPADTAASHIGFRCVSRPR